MRQQEKQRRLLQQQQQQQQQRISIDAVGSGDSEYLLGASPTSLDAIVFGYVATVAKIPFPNATLQQHLVNKCPNLVDYMERIINVYFPECVASVSGRE